MQIKLGTLGEFWAIDYLTNSRGYILLLWNYVSRHCQQDLVFLHPSKNKLIFVEVKTSKSFNILADSVQTLSYAKLNKRKLAAQQFSKKFKLNFKIDFGLIKIKSKDESLNPVSLFIEYSEGIYL